MKSSAGIGKALLILSVCAVSAAWAELPVGVHYRNDFATRESARAIPELNRWYSAKPYPTSNTQLTTRPPKFLSWRAAYAPEYDTDVDGPLSYAYDAWRMPDINNSYKLTPGYRYSLDGINNGCFYYYYGSNTKRYGHTLTPFMNDISNGVLRMCADFRAPVRWEQSYSYVMLSPAFRRQLDVMSWGGENVGEKAQVTPYDCIGQFGLGTQGTLTANQIGLHRGKSEYLATNFWTGAAVGKHWFRFVVDYDLDRQKMSGNVYDLGTGRPGMDTATSSAVATFADIDFYTKGKVTPANPLAAIDISGYGGMMSNSTVTNKVFVDNIQCSWKRPGGADFESFYENDFETRRYRILNASSTTAASYVQTPVTGLVTNEFQGYRPVATKSNNTATRGIMPPLLSSGTTVQPVGYDGWRRVGFDKNNDGYTPITYFPSDTNPKLYTSSNGKFNSLAQSFGTRLTSGKVRLRVCVRLPNLSYKSLTTPTLARDYVLLGDENLYEATTANIASRYAVMAGVQYTATAGATNRYPFVETADGRMTDTGHNLAYTTWYQLDLMADIDRKTYDLSLYAISTNNAPNAEAAPIGSAILSVPDIPFMNGVDGLATFVLGGFGGGSDISTLANCNRYTWWDNILVEAVAADGTAQLVYSNTFDKSRRVTEKAPGDQTEVKLASQYDLDDGPDSWWWCDRQSVDMPYPVATGGADAHAKVTGYQAAANYVVQPLGRTLTEGKYVLDVVMRSPANFTANGGGGMVLLGDEVMLQGRRPAVAANSYDSHYLVKLGFIGRAWDRGGSDSDNSEDTLFVSKVAACGNDPATGTLVTAVATNLTIDVSSWYRFVAKIDMDARTYATKVYKLGADHPTVASPRGTLVATLPARAFTITPQGGLASVGLLSYAVSGHDGTPDDRYALLVDRIELRDAPGCVILIR